MPALPLPAPERVVPMLGRVGVAGGLGTRLTDPTLHWFLAAMSGEMTAAQWLGLAYVTVASQMTQEAVDWGRWRDEVDELSPDAVARSLRGVAGEVGWRWQGAGLVSLHWAARREALREDLRAVGQGTLSAERCGLRGVVALQDEPPEGEALQRAWRAALRLMNLLRLLPLVWFVTRRGRELDYGAVGAVHDFGGGADGWQGVLVELQRKYQALGERLRGLGVMAPDAVGQDLPDARGRACGAVAEMAWTAQAVAVVARGDLELARRAVGWRVFCAEELERDVGPLVAALGAANDGGPRA